MLYKNGGYEMRILREEVVCLIIDIQEKLIKSINDYEDVVKKTKALIRGLEILDVPLLVTQQYTAGLGDTISEIKDMFIPFKYLEKASFSCMDDQLFEQKIKDINKREVVIAGIESHICVLQTAIDLKSKGFDPIVIVDAIGSRNPMDKEIALKRMEQEGIKLATVESILFEMCRFSGNKKFKEILEVVK